MVVGIYWKKLYTLCQCKKWNLKQASLVLLMHTIFLIYTSYSIGLFLYFTDFCWRRSWTNYYLPGIGKCKKPQLSAKSQFWKKLKKTQEILFFLNDNFFTCFLDFFRSGTLQRAEVFLFCNQSIKTLHLSYQMTL